MKTLRVQQLQKYKFKQNLPVNNKTVFTPQNLEIFGFPLLTTFRKENVQFIY